MPQTVIGWTLTVLGAVAGYELVRHAVVSGARRRLREGALAFTRRHNIRLDSARFIDRAWLREQLLLDSEIDHALVASAEEQGLPPAVLRPRVELYIDEIVPAFSLTAYYRVAAVLARGISTFAYEVVFDRAEVDRAVAQVPPGAVAVYVINHRSNADFVVLTYGLLRHVALSYAVGEWARVWPLDALFRAFGGYFVRRGEKDRLYHKVLERYVQRILAKGGVTGFFIEGGLSRDGRLRPPKAGLLDYMIGLQRENAGREIAFIPVGINYDRVLEDRHLLAEAGGRKARPTLLDKGASALKLLLRLPVLIGANLVKVALRSHRKLGYAAISVGSPVLLSTLCGGDPVCRLPEEERRLRVKEIAERLLESVAEQIPATPVPVFCLALLQDEDRGDRAVLERIRRTLAALRDAGASLAFGLAFPRLNEARSTIPGLEDEVEGENEAEMVLTLAGFALERRGLLSHRAGAFHVEQDGEEVLKYYARSIEHHLGRSGR